MYQKKCKGRTTADKRCRRVCAEHHDYCYMHGLQDPQLKVKKAKLAGREP